MSEVIKFDYDSILDRMKQSASDKNLLTFGVLENILAPVAKEMEYQMNATEYYSYENFWNKARNRSSLLAQSGIFSYNIPRMKGAEGTVRISTNKNFNVAQGSYNVYIKKFDQFKCSDNGLYYCADNDYILDKEEKYVDITVVQGEYKSLTKLAEGVIDETITIEDGNIERNMFDVTVNGISYVVCDTLMDKIYSDDDENDNNYCSATYNSDLSILTIQFGDNLHGKKLSSGDTIIIKYLSTEGEEGNISSTGLIDKISSALYNDDNESVTAYCTNTTTITNGADYPTLEEIRITAPKVFNAGDRGNTCIDIETILTSNGYASKVKCWGIFDELEMNGYDGFSTDLHDIENIIHIIALDGNYDNLTESAQQNILKKIYKKCDPTNIYQFEECEKIPLVFNIDCNINDSSLTPSVIKSYITTALNSNYKLSTMNFGESIYLSDVISLLDSVDGIDNLLLTFQSYISDELTTNSFKDTIPIQSVESAELYVIENDTSTKVATVDSNSVITSTSSTFEVNTDASIINLQSGLCNVVFSNDNDFDFDTNTYQYKLVYHFYENKNIDCENKQILYYDNCNITCNY